MTQTFGFLSRTLLVAALCIAAAGMISGVRAARADMPPVAPSADAQKAAWLFVGQSTSSPAAGMTLMQVLWGGSKGKDGEHQADNAGAFKPRQNPPKQKHRSIPTPNSKEEYR